MHPPMCDVRRLIRSKMRNPLMFYGDDDHDISLMEPTTLGVHEFQFSSRVGLPYFTDHCTPHIIVPPHIFYVHPTLQIIY